MAMQVKLKEKSLFSRFSLNILWQTKQYQSISARFADRLIFIISVAHDDFCLHQSSFLHVVKKGDPYRKHRSAFKAEVTWSRIYPYWPTG